MDEASPSITCCITELDVGGAENAFARIAVGLHRRGWTVRVISLRDAGPLAKGIMDAGIPVTALNCGGMADLRAVRRLANALRSAPSDVLLCFLNQANIYGRLARCVLRFTDRAAEPRLLVSGVRVADRRASVVWPDRLTSRLCDHYIAVSPSVARLHAELCSISADRISTICNGVDLLPDHDVVTGHSSETFELLYVGRLVPQKAPLDLLQAFSQLPALLRERCRLSFVGDGPLRESIQKTAAQYGISHLVHLHGRSDDVRLLMRRADLLVLPSLWEGLPNVVLESMAEGLPVLATEVDGIRDLIVPGETGWLVRPGDPASLSRAMEVAISDPDLRRTFAKNAQHVVTQKFSWNLCVERYDRLLRDLLNSPRQILESKDESEFC